ncbi:hypothetical protein GCM10010174_59110 [Kutzneria viridogrisea]|uniref:HAD family hydrolase n=2 Tax=Kutzneria TaxID=43356 RepID=W5W3N9_9PSEU|nr:HAD family hydrolase [Kutzneria albida]AHH95395.1 hypothetical protein KALB_2026 [Kutzneria albida DSM 43870]MBA8927246.1 putative hydrolase of the HAD superfamily [Kutzneria viridogrisea]
MNSAVLLDVGGVLLMPNPAIMSRAIVGIFGRPAAVEFDRAHYLAVAATDAIGYFDRDVYRRTYARSLGVPAEYENDVVANMTRVFTGFDWTRVALGAVRGLRRLVATGVSVGIVSNSTGTVAGMLAGGGVCQVGDGPLCRVETIVDSGAVGVEKPDPEIFRIALDAMGVPATGTVYVGDTARIDVDGARRAGLRPLHFVPLNNCPDPAGDHEHVTSLDEVVELVVDG